MIPNEGELSTHIIARFELLQVDQVSSDSDFGVFSAIILTKK